MRVALVTGSSGFLGRKLCVRLRAEGYRVFGVDKYLRGDLLDGGVVGDLESKGICTRALGCGGINEVYHLAAEVGGILFNRGRGEFGGNLVATVNLLEATVKVGVEKVFFPSTLGVYKETGSQGVLVEEDAYPAEPPESYGWVKLISERLVLGMAREGGYSPRIARVGTLFGVGAPWRGGKELLPAAMCREALMAEEGGAIEVMGDGASVRSYVEVTDCVEGIRVLMGSGVDKPVNLVSWEATVKEVAEMAIGASGRELGVQFRGPAVSGIRRVDGSRMRRLGWEPKYTKEVGFGEMLAWIKKEMV